MPEWSAELDFSAEQARHLIEQQFPQLSPVRIKPAGEGWDNWVFRVNDDYGFRFPRRQLGATVLAFELQVLPWIGSQLELPIPVPCLMGQPAPGYPWPFAGHRWIEGRTACQAGLSGAARAALAEPLARFLRALHALPADQARQRGAPPDLLARLDLARRLPRAQTLLAQLAEEGLIADPRPLAQALERVPPGFVPRGDVLVHGDLYARHLVLGPRHELVGVIDWGDLHLGDPALDLALAQTLLPAAAHPAFRAAYGPIAPDCWQVARLRAIWHTLLLVRYASAQGEESLLRESQQAAGFLAAQCGD
jgi:aminoglycoside phosphotransferase (APT) family kinase protein